ncbi:hypothetical protein [Mesotoga prima]|uniref:hypothetical protein n=1 Tax=Mesotoga prima TaxID=1184387 RepID=UPI002FD9CE5F
MEDKLPEGEVIYQSNESILLEPIHQGVILNSLRVIRIYRDRPGLSKLYLIIPRLEGDQDIYRNAVQIIGIRENRVFYYSNMLYIYAKAEIESIEEQIDKYEREYPHGTLGRYNRLETYFHMKNTVRPARAGDYIMQVLGITKHVCPFRMLRGFGRQV